MKKFKLFLIISFSSFLQAEVETDVKAVAKPSAENKVKPKDKAELDSHMANNKDKTKVVEFFAQWCGFCQMFDGLLDGFANENPDIVLVQIDVDKFGDLSKEFGVQAMPTSFVFKGGQGFKPENKFSVKLKDADGNEQELNSVMGADLDKLKTLIDVAQGKKKAEDVTLPAQKRPKAPPVPSGPLAPLGAYGMMIEQIVGKDLMEDLGQQLPDAFGKFMDSPVLEKSIGKVADALGDVIEEIVNHLDLSQDSKDKVDKQLEKAKDEQNKQHAQIKPMIEKMNPQAAKVASHINTNLNKVIDRASKSVKNKKASAPKQKKVDPASVDQKTTDTAKKKNDVKSGNEAKPKVESEA